jgi:hypothetical protein
VFIRDNLWPKYIFIHKISVIGGQKSAEICGFKMCITGAFSDFFWPFGSHCASFCVVLARVFIRIFTDSRLFPPFFAPAKSPILTN